MPLLVALLAVLGLACVLGCDGFPCHLMIMTASIRRASVGW